jgi:membrane-associated phospholipid phosphatase
LVSACAAVRRDFRPRVQIARHYPTDIYAGRVLAQAIVKHMKKNQAFNKDFEGSKAELAAATN